MATKNFVSAANAQALLQGIFDKAKHEIEVSISPAISSGSTDATSASAKAVYDFVVGAIGDIVSFSFEIVEVLPASGQSNIIYLVPRTGESTNVFDEWAYIGGEWEQIGVTEIDLSNYWNRDDLVEMTAADVTAILDGIA